MAYPGPAPRMIPRLLPEACPPIVRVRQRDPGRDKLINYERDRRNDYGNSKKSGRKGVPWRESWVNRSFRRAVSRSLVTQDPDTTDDRVAALRGVEWRKVPGLPLGLWVVRKGGVRASNDGERRADASGLRQEAERRLLSDDGRRRPAPLGLLTSATRLGAIPAKHMSTHAIKTELQSLLQTLAPDKRWPKRPGITELSDFALHRFSPEDNDPRVWRALELASVMWFHERS